MSCPEEVKFELRPLVLKLVDEAVRTSRDKEVWLNQVQDAMNDLFDKAWEVVREKNNERE